MDVETGPPKSPPETTDARRDQKDPKPIADVRKTESAFAISLPIRVWNGNSGAGDRPRDTKFVAIVGLAGSQSVFRHGVDLRRNACTICCSTKASHGTGGFRHARNVA